MTHDELLAAFGNRTGTVGVVGLGAVGLPLARTFTRAGFRVLGFDRDAQKLARLADGTGAPAHLGPDFAAELVDSGQFEVADDPERLAELAAALVCVPTPMTSAREPDLADVLDAAAHLARWVPRGALVVLESTTWPGTTRGPFADVFRAVGRAPGDDVLLAFSPEREDPGRVIDRRSVPKLVGGTCARSASAARTLYTAAFEHVVAVSSAEVAESAKLLENVYRAVNIALVNELKVAFHAIGVDVGEVLDAAATKPFGFQRFAPGPGTGGHCIPIDPHYLAWAARAAGAAVPLVDVATRVNAGMPAYVVERAEAALSGRGRTTRADGDARRGDGTPLRSVALPLRRVALPLRGVGLPLRGVGLPLRGAALALRGIGLPPRGQATPLRGPESPLRGARVLVLGLAYKPDVDITAESPALAILTELRERGADVAYSDPHVATAPEGAALAPDRRASVTLDARTVADADLVLVVTDHAAFDWDLVAREARLVVDARRALETRMHGDPRYFTA